MDIKTKFNIGDKIVLIECFSEEVFASCNTCNGTGQIEVKGKSFECPDCYGNLGETKLMPRKWGIYNDKNILSNYDKIIRVNVETTKKGTSITYMLGHRYTQSSLGNLWTEDVLFSSIEEALAECNKRNLELDKSV